jgi:aspartyl-tRNA(Asn)/glutamyl-tRNA(Gln) amidotransferase subunit B
MTGISSFAIAFQHHRIFAASRFYSGWTVNSETGVVSHRGNPKFQTIIGLEIHAQLDIATKLFSGCPVGDKGTMKPNSFVWPMDVAVPGVLPRLSQEAVQAAVLSAATLNCTLPPVSRFERKHYFYADLPLGYQITQQRWPLGRDGYLACRRTSSGKTKKKARGEEDVFTTYIERIQLEQDTGKTTVMTNPSTKEKESLVDFNRAGRALIEIVFHPDLRSAADAAMAVETLCSLLKHIGTCDGKMEEGSLRCDLNVSIAKLDLDEGDGEMSQETILQRSGNRVEVKNLNSLRQIQQAAEFEAIRQAEAFDLGAPTAQETRTFDVKSGETVTIRNKGGAKDYRFMPEPDLPPLVLNEEVFGKDCKTLGDFLDNNLPELPEAASRRLQTDFFLSDYIAGVLVSDPPAIRLFEEAVQEAMKQLGPKDNCLKQKVPETVANLLSNELFSLVRELEMKQLVAEGLLNSAGRTSVEYSKINGVQLGETVALLLEGTISNTMAKQLLRVLYEEDVAKLPRQMAHEKGFQLITDTTTLSKICHAVIADHPKEMERYKLGGKFAKKITKLLMGKAMAAAQGNAHPERLNGILLEVLKEMAPLAEV